MDDPKKSEIEAEASAIAEELIAEMERVHPDEGHPFTIMGFAQDHAPEVVLGVAAVIIVIVITEIGKPWIKLLMARFSISETLEASALRTISFLVCALPVWSLDFRQSWQIMTDSQELLDWPSAMLIGMSMTWAGVQITWLLLHDVRPVKAIRLAFYKRIGVTEADMQHAREQGGDSGSS